MKLSVQPKLKHNNVCLIRYNAGQDCEMHYMNAWLKRCVFDLDLNRESVSEPRTLSGRLFQSLGAKYEKVLPPIYVTKSKICAKWRMNELLHLHSFI